MSGDIVQSTLVPVPLGNLVNGHSDLLSNRHLFSVRPDRLLLEVLFEKLHLPLFLAHASPLLPFLHVLLILLVAHISQSIWHRVNKGPLATCPNQLCILLTLLILAKGHVPPHGLLSLLCVAAKLADSTGSSSHQIRLLLILLYFTLILSH